MTPGDITAFTAVAFKLFIILGLVIYALFAGIMVRQEQLMAQTFKDASERYLRIGTIVHFAASVFVILLAVVLL